MNANQISTQLILLDSLIIHKSSIEQIILYEKKF